MEEKLIWAIRLTRLLSACVEVSAALLLLRMSRPRAMLRLNSHGSGWSAPPSSSRSAPSALRPAWAGCDRGGVVVLLGIALVVWGTR